MSTIGITSVIAHAESRPSKPSAPSVRLIYGAIFGVALLALFGGGTARYAIPVVTTAAAYMLYRKSPSLYVSFVWWLFFLICFIRRIIDYRTGYSEVNAVLAAPYLAALVCTPTVFARSDVWRLRISVPFILAFTASLYGLFVGLLFTPAKNLVVSGLAWFCPLIFGFYMLTEMTSSSRRDEHLAALERTFSWGTLIMGFYGVYQFLTAPRWDVIWMTETLPKMGSIGSPEPYEIRVFSTMNGPGALAYALTTGLLVLLARRRAISLASAAAGFSALLLSSVRASWGVLVIGLVLFAWREKRYIGKLLAASCLLIACASVVMLIQPLRERVEDRFASFSHMSDDTSYQERTSGYEEMVTYAAETPLGDGLGILDAKFQGKTSLGARDSGIWEIILSLGWIGAAVYFLALGALAWTAWNTRVAHDPVHSVAVCIAVGLLAQIPMGTVVGLTGMTIWTFGAIAIAPRSSLVTT
jgi:O-Antigen ligase